MKLIDISWPLSAATTAYKDRHVINFEDTKDFTRDGVRETKITLGSHSGTHIDAPSHFLKNGKTIDELSLDRFVGKSMVLDMSHCSRRITRDDLLRYDELIPCGDMVLLRTTNSFLSTFSTFDSDFVYLASCGAQYLIEKKVKAVGIDYLGIERDQQGHTTHASLMNADIVIIEGLRLGHVEQGAYLLFCLPLNVIGLEAAPTRAVLIDYRGMKI